MGDTETIRSCSRFDDSAGKPCGKPVDGKGAWCKACRNSYQRDYVAKQSEMERSQGYAAGAKAMRDALAEWFSRVPRGMFNGADVTENIRAFRMPNMPPSNGNGKVATQLSTETTPVPA